MSARRKKTEIENNNEHKTRGQVLIQSNPA